MTTLIMSFIEREETPTENSEYLSSYNPPFPHANQPLNLLKYKSHLI